MISYRVVRQKYADLKGYGARLYGGRFNSPGTAAVYTSQNIALALLEVLVHIDKAEVPEDYVVMAIRFARRIVNRPRERTVLRAESWATQPAPEDYKRPSLNLPILCVPSVIIPREYNYVLFPETGGFQAGIDWIEPLDFDSCLLASAGR